jgi:hypothetical protein
VLSTAVLQHRIELLNYFVVMIPIRSNDCCDQLFCFDL